MEGGQFYYEAMISAFIIKKVVIFECYRMRSLNKYLAQSEPSVCTVRIIL